MKFVPQSDQQLLGFPLKETNRRNAIRNVSVLLSVSSSRWTALVVMQVNIIACASFSVFRPSRTCRGPNMSMAVSMVDIWVGYVVESTWKRITYQFLLLHQVYFVYCNFLIIHFWNAEDSEGEGQENLVHFCSILIVSKTAWPLIYPKISSWELTLSNIRSIAGYGRNAKHYMAPLTKKIATVVQKVDSAIHWINFFPVDNAIGFPKTYLLDGDRTHKSLKH